MSRSTRHRDLEQEEDDDEWLFDSIVAFLKSPIWSTPIQQFVESNCSIFSPTEGWSGGALLEDEVSSRSVPREHYEVHAKYKELVDLLINTFIQDLGVSYGQFVRACKKSNRLAQRPVYFELFEQVWAADNFEIFKSQMTKKNIELELQALILLQHQLGLIDGGMGAAGQEHDDVIMDIVIRKSKDEYDNLVNSRQRLSSFGASSGGGGGGSRMPPSPVKKPQDLETAKKIVKSEELVESLKQELDQQEYKNKRLMQELIDAPDDSSARRRSERSPPSSSSSSSHRDRDRDRDRPSSSSSRRQLPPPRGPGQIANDLSSLKLYDDSTGLKHGGRRRHGDDDDDVQTDSSTDKIVNSLAQSYLAQAGGNVSESELRRRAEFMGRQRELLAEKKRVERQKQLDAFMKESEMQGEPRRPMSSRAARDILSGADPNELAPGGRSDEERKRMEARRALAETLKNEVVNNSKPSTSSSSSSSHHRRNN